MKLPIFVARQWVRHRTASLNEISARYTEVDDETFLPETWSLQSKENKQGSDGDVEHKQGYLTRVANTVMVTAFGVYNILLENGVSREQARSVLPVATYTRWVWKMDLHNLMHLLALRTDPHAQYETRVYAEAIYVICQQLWPVTMEAFDDYVLAAYTLSRHEGDIIRTLLKGDNSRQHKADRESVMRNLRRIYVEGGKMTDTEFVQFRREFEL